MILKRDIYSKLLKWKNMNSHKVLELRGARQVGKTYILNLFAREFQSYIYINMLGSTGQRFLQCLEAVSATELGQIPCEEPFHRAFELYQPDFHDDEGVLVVIDEIQDSPAVYSKMGELSRAFECRFIVTGSYWGETREKDCFLAAGDSDYADYDTLAQYFDTYLQIGGYPEVVKTYVQTRSMEACADMIENHVATFIKESTRYFDSPLETEAFHRVFSSMAATMLKDKNGRKDLASDLRSITSGKEGLRGAKKTVKDAIKWLYFSHQIGCCSKNLDGNNINIVENCRYYFMDLGIANRFLSLTGTVRETIDRCLCENFVCLNLVDRMKHGEFVGQIPWFGMNEKTGGALDFYVRSRLDYKDYRLEAEPGNEMAVPLYLVGRRGYELGSTM